MVKKWPVQILQSSSAPAVFSKLMKHSSLNPAYCHFFVIFQISSASTISE